jgi:hypothetical protein
MTARIGSVLLAIVCCATACAADDGTSDEDVAVTTHGTGGAVGTGGNGDATGATGGAPEGTGGILEGSGGAATGGDSNCFPSITDFAARDGGFGSAEREIVQIGTGDSVSLFRPADASFGQADCQFPLLVWGNGSTNTVDIWAGHLSRAASYGFVVVAPEQTQVNSGHMM